ncbi:MAG: hypothetical protein V4773_18720 [Verrucomicrobiota bacterium]
MTVGRIILGVILSLVVCELVCRQFYFAPVAWDKEAGWVFSPGEVVSFVEGGSKSTWTTHGVRRNQLPPADSKIVLALGDSFTEAVQVGDEEVYTTKLEHALNGARSDFAVLNLGRSGTSVADYIAAAPRLKQRFNPQWTVIQMGELDMTDEAWDQDGAAFSWVKPNMPQLTIEDHLGQPPTGKIRRFVHSIRNSSALCANVLRRVNEFAALSKLTPPLFNATRRNAGGGAPAFRKVFPIEQEIDLLVKAFDGRVTILWTTPFHTLRSPAKASEVDDRVTRHAVAQGISIVALGEIYRQNSRKGIALTGFTNTQPFKGHWNQVGHATIGELLGQELKQRIGSN